VTISFLSSTLLHAVTYLEYVIRPSYTDVAHTVYQRLQLNLSLMTLCWASRRCYVCTHWDFRAPCSLWLVNRRVVLCLTGATAHVAHGVSSWRVLADPAVSTW